MQKEADGQDTPRNAFSVVLGFVLESTRKLTWLELVGVGGAPASCAWSAPDAVVESTATTHVIHAMRVDLRREALSLFSTVCASDPAVRWEGVNMRNNLPVERHGSIHNDTTGPQFIVGVQEIWPHGLFDTACF